MPLDDEVTASEAAEELNPQNDETKEETVIEESAQQKVEKAIAKGEEKEESELKESEEEATEPKKEHEPPPESPRFKQVYGDLKRSQREVSSLKKEMGELKTQIKGVTDERADEKQKATDAEIDSLWNDYETAMTDLDGAKAAKIHRKIDRLEKGRSVKSVASSRSAQKDDEIDKKVLERENDRAIKGFYKRNPWMDKDNEEYNSRMRKYAIAAEDELLESGYDGSYSELLAEVEKDVKEAFKTKKPSGLPNVVGVNATKRTVADKSTSLNDAQKAMAHNVYSGIPKEEAEAKYIKIFKKHGGRK